MEKGGGWGLQNAGMGKRGKGPGRAAPGTFLSLWKAVLVTSYPQSGDFR